VSQGFPGINPGLPHGYDIDVDAPVYAISIAAQLAGLHPQTLRQYDRLGLVSPDRTGGRNRLYSLRDVARLREVTQLSNDGVTSPASPRFCTCRRRLIRSVRNSKRSARVFENCCARSNPPRWWSGSRSAAVRSVSRSVR
jgi:MerR family transcriptional regulator/heat shock protein HspR